jgi:hypothetical protein
MDNKNEFERNLSLPVVHKERCETPYPNDVGSEDPVDILGTLVIQSISPTNYEPNNIEDCGND